VKRNEKEPDFKQLNDRLIADAPNSPFLAIRTNLDTDDALSENPYAKEVEDETKKEELQEFFDDGAN